MHPFIKMTAAHLVAATYFLSANAGTFCIGYLEEPFPFPFYTETLSDRDKGDFENSLKNIFNEDDYYKKIDQIASYFLLNDCKATKARLLFHEKKLCSLSCQGDADKLHEIGGYLVSWPVSRQKAATSIEKCVHEVVQNVWNRLYFAGYGYSTFEKSLYEVDRLQNCLSKYLPEALCFSDDEKIFQMNILWKGYRIQDEVFKEKIEAIRLEDLIVEKLNDVTEDVPVLGLQEIWIVKDKKDGSPLVIAKNFSDIYFGKKIAKLLGYDEDDENSATNRRFAKIAGWNELLASSMNQMLEGKLLSPLSAYCGVCTLHAYRNNKGSFYGRYFKKQTLLEPLEVYFKRIGARRMQQTFLSHFLNHSLDAHLNNLLVEDDSLVLIDFGRSLGSHLDDSAFVVRNATFELPFLNQLFEPLFKKLVHAVTPEIFNRLCRLADQCIDDDEILFLVKKNIEHQRANVLAVKAAIDLNATPHQLMAMKIAKLCKKEWAALGAKFYEKYGFKISSKKASYIHVKTLLNEHKIPLQAPFHKIWTDCMDGAVLDEKLFSANFQNALMQLQKTPFKSYFLEEDILWWSKAGKWVLLPKQPSK